MSYALETSKRKFHRILESISNTSGNSLASAHARNASSSSLAADQPPSKRARTNGSAAASAALRLESRSNEELSAPSARSLRAVSPKSTAPQQRIAFTTLCGDRVQPYAPSSRQDFLLRLKTFSFHGIVNWHLKPEAINEVQWAKHGWVLQGKETVRCTNCHKQVVVDESTDTATGPSPSEEGEREEDSDASKEDNRHSLAERYVELMRGGHDLQCLWRERPCDDTIYRLPVNTYSKAIPALKERYESVLRVLAQLPPLREPPSLDASGILQKFNRRVYGGDRPAPSVELAEGSKRSEIESKQAAFAFALLGWYSAADQLNDGMVRCGACFRRLGFWMWPHEPETGPDSDPEPMLCDIVEEHRPYCPWRNGDVQNAGAAKYHYYDDQLAGWECLVRLLNNHNGSTHEARPTSSSVQSTAGASEADANGIISDSASVQVNGEDVDQDHRERLGRWKRLRKTLALSKMRKP